MGCMIALPEHRRNLATGGVDMYPNSAHFKACTARRVTDNAAAAPAQATIGVARDKEKQAPNCTAIVSTSWLNRAWDLEH